MMTNQTDIEADPRPFAEVLADWVVDLHDGKRYGARPPAAAALAVSQGTLDQWLKGRAPAHEKSFRRLMALILRSKSKPTISKSNRRAAKP